MKVFHVSWNALETVFHEMLWKKSFTVYPCLKCCFNISSHYYIQKQLSRTVLKKRCSENMQHIYRRTPIPKCDFNKVALQLYWNCTLTCVFCCKFATYFQNTFSKEDRWVAASAHTNGRWCFKCFICKNSSDEQSAFDRL